MNTIISRLLLASTLSLPLAALAAPAAGPTQPTAGAPAAGSPASEKAARCHDGHQHGHHMDGKRGHRGHGAHGRHGERDGKPFFLRQLTLSETQNSQIQALLSEQEKTRKENREAARKARTELLALSAADKFDDKRAQRLSQDAAAAQAELELARVRTHARIMQLLTPEQRQQLRQQLQEKAKRFEERQAAVQS